MNQKTGEIHALCDLIYNDQSQFLLEIGNEKGDTLSFMSQFASPTAILIGVDVNPVPIPKLATDMQKVYLIQGDSHQIDALQAVKEALKGNYLDFLFIDGDHFGAYQDYKMYGPLVRKGGIIAFHDIVQGLPRNVGRVPETWDVIKRGKNTLEIVDDWKQGGWGIGVIRV